MMANLRKEATVMTNNIYSNLSHLTQNPKNTPSMPVVHL